MLGRPPTSMARGISGIFRSSFIAQNTTHYRMSHAMENRRTRTLILGAILSPTKASTIYMGTAQESYATPAWHITQFIKKRELALWRVLSIAKQRNYGENLCVSIALFILRFFGEFEEGLRERCTLRWRWINHCPPPCMVLGLRSCSTSHSGKKK